MVTEARAYVRPVDSCITQLKAEGPSRTIHESREEGEEELGGSQPGSYFDLFCSCAAPQNDFTMLYHVKTLHKSHLPNKVVNLCVILVTVHNESTDVCGH